MWWDLVDKPFFLQNSAQQLGCEWFGKDLVDATVLGLFDIFRFDMTCNCEDLEISYTLKVEVPLLFCHLDQLSDALAGLIAVHERHAAVGQDELIPVDIILLDSGFNHLYCLLPVVPIIRDS